MRPHYETAADQTREAVVMNQVVANWNHPTGERITDFYKIENISYGTDFWMETTDGFQVLEIKCRKKKYPFFLVAMKKIMTARLWEDVGIPAHLCVHWEEDDSLYVARPFGENATPLTPEWNGRTKQGRGDKADMEPHARFKLTDMRKL
jgi:hypothetical protein|tara:strand:- start:124 stop:570 length:447 start_codon:yes stop_codon:yes gene_type:complete